MLSLLLGILTLFKMSHTHTSLNQFKVTDSHLVFNKCLLSNNYIVIPWPDCELLENRVFLWLILTDIPNVKGTHRWLQLPATDWGPNRFFSSQSLWGLRLRNWVLCSFSCWPPSSLLLSRWQITTLLTGVRKLYVVVASAPGLGSYSPAKSVTFWSQAFLL